MVGWTIGGHTNTIAKGISMQTKHQEEAKRNERTATRYDVLILSMKAIQIASHKFDEMACPKTMVCQTCCMSNSTTQQQHVRIRHNTCCYILLDCCCCV